MPNRQPPPSQQQQHHQQQAAHPPQPVHQGPGLFGQMASTAAGVAVGSAVGHTLANGVSGMFGGGSQQETAPDQSYQQQAPQQQYQQQQQQPLSCDENAKALTKCLSDNNNDVSACQWYLDALKACQQMSSQY
ncbi:hypothetical protein K492DRAFT_57403 [Lichtheimia hyalospora FSU 10163]|nr:hypothetical protein K492DRAFT_57403 [Lichtheimia hyalospora FSU 10163]